MTHCVSFASKAGLDAWEAHQRGHIHDTFISTWAHDGVSRRYLHQRINNTVFTNVAAVMHNIERVTEHFRDKPNGESQAHGISTLKLVSAASGASYVELPSGSWRTYEFIENSVSYDVCEGREMAFEVARAFGWFQSQLIDLDPDDLQMTIPQFFDSAHRAVQLDEVLGAGPERLAEVTAELAFVDARRALIEHVEPMPTRIVHGDTKLNNVLFDRDSGAPKGIVDLDTCMPGVSLYDFGDLVRFTAATCREDEADLDAVDMDLDLYRALAEGYLDHAADFLTPAEIEWMPFAAQWVTLTVGVRFLTDYLAGDVYFKTSRPGHNLDRARVQFRLVQSMERQRSAMKR